MPILMVVWISFGVDTFGLRQFQVEINSMQACRDIGQQLTDAFVVAGLCIDKFSGATVVWGPAGDTATGPGHEPPREPTTPEPDERTF